MLVFPYNVESVEIDPPAVKEARDSMNYTAQVKDNPWNLLGQGALKGGCQGILPPHRVG